MQIWQGLGGQAHWIWIGVGILLCAMEMIAAGVFLLWFGLAAIVTGILLTFIPMSAVWSLIVFAVLSVGSVLVGWKIYGARTDDDDQPFLNRRAEAMIGKSYILARPITGGQGSITINDTSWRVNGMDMPAGTRVKVTGVVDAMVLQVVQD
ncbi:MAG: NfeD family protein [Beijerinckiaceae bacterium]|jgi:inner membrane protein|nr:NfeD family protein [Beijerinckiaceae bacterium]